MGECRYVFTNIIGMRTTTKKYLIMVWCQVSGGACGLVESDEVLSFCTWHVKCCEY